VAAVESLGVDRVIFLPDEYLANYVASQTEVDIIPWQGHCEVHERFTGDELRLYREDNADIYILAHPECPEDVLQEADFVGSTSGMIRHIGDRHPERVLMVTECSMSDNVAVEFPKIDFIRPCNLCPHMKQITLPKILQALEHMQYDVKVDDTVAQRARLAVERMVAIGRREKS
jgi:quinolinate synthase